MLLMQVDVTTDVFGQKPVSAVDHFWREIAGYVDEIELPGAE